jgi:hypothetical protein
LTLPASLARHHDPSPDATRRASEERAMVEMILGGEMRE